MPDRSWRKLWHLIGGTFCSVSALFVSRKVLPATPGTASAALVALLLIPVDDNFSIPFSGAGTMTLTTLYFR